MVIIGIILGFVLVAAMDAANRANERATQALIAKLDAGVSDRLEALLANRPQPNYTHGYIAAIYSTLAITATNPMGMLPSPMTTPSAIENVPQLNPAVRTTDRAQVIAWYDYIKSELPDVFFIQPNNQSYPINFAGVVFPGTAIDSPANVGNIKLPLGHVLAGPYPNGFGDGGVTYPNLGIYGSGINGASYTAAAALYKNIPGISPLGCDAADNDGDGLIDNLPEWGPNVSILNLTTNHKHSTARAEMLYAILVEGSGPWGSVFSRTDFTDREVQDTDGDGLPEFVDAWGQPLQFFRWPVYYHSDLQRGQLIEPDTSQAQPTWDLLPPYYDAFNNQFGMFRERETNPLDRNQQLMAPGWWSTQGSGGIAANNNYVTRGAPVPYATPVPQQPVPASGGVMAFEALFHPLSEPDPNPGGAMYWDRSGNIYPARRAFYTKFLILSGGQDQQPGVFLYSDAAMQQNFGAGATPFLIANENCAMQFGLDMFGGGTSQFPNAGFTANASLPAGPSGGWPSFTTANSNSDPTYPYSYDLFQAGQDDITNHNLQATGGIGGS